MDIASRIFMTSINKDQGITDNGPWIPRCRRRGTPKDCKASSVDILQNICKLKESNHETSNTSMKLLGKNVCEKVRTWNVEAYINQETLTV